MSVSIGIEPAGALRRPPEPDLAQRRAPSIPQQPDRRAVMYRRSVWAIGAIFGAWAFLPFVLAAINAARAHQLFLGAAGNYPYDSLQYLAWVRDAQGGLIRNLYGSQGAALFVHPMWSPSGWIQALTGVSDAAIMAFWKAVSVCVLVGGCARLVARHIPPAACARRVVALVLTLLAGVTAPLALLLIAHGVSGQTTFSVSVELIPMAALWDWAQLAIALGLMAFAIDGIERVVAGARDRRSIAQPALLGLLVAWLHPWQGETLVLVALCLAAWRWHDDNWATDGHGVLRALRRRAVPIAPIAALTALPLVYYFMLSKVDAGWATASATDTWLEHVPATVLLTEIVPVVLVTLRIAQRRATADPTLRPLIAWTLATVATLAVTSSGQYRALDGISIPFVVLVVKLWPVWRRRASLLTACALLITLVPTGVFVVDSLQGIGTRGNRVFTQLRPSDLAAARAAGRVAGGDPVLTEGVLGSALPVVTNAASWIGHPVWTPHYNARVERSFLLIGGGMTAAEARQFVNSIPTNAVLQPCGFRAPLQPVLAPLGFHVRHYGCATLYSRRA